MKKLLTLFAICLGLSFGLLAPLQAQNVNGYYANFAWTATTIAGQTTFTPIPDATIQICNYPANAVPCTNLATLYLGPTVAGGTGPNPITADQYGNFGFWAGVGTYQYTMTTTGGQSIGPFPVVLGGGSGGGGGTPGGSFGAVQYNANGGFGGVSGSGLLKLNSTLAPSIASAGVDYLSPTGSGAGLTGVALLGAQNFFTSTQNAPIFAATTGVTAPSITDSGLTAGNCMQAGSGGLLTTTSAPCGSGSGGIGYPPAGVPLSTGSAWGSSYAVGTAANNLVQVNGSGQLPALNSALLYNLTAANLSGTAPITIAGSETLSFNASPTFSTVVRQSYIGLTGNITSFTLAAASDGQEKTLTFCQLSSGNYTVTPPSNVFGFMTVGPVVNTCSSQHFSYSVAQTAWIADSQGVVGLAGAAPPAPTIAAGAGAGTSPTVAIVGGSNNDSGFFTVTTGSAPSVSATVATISFGNPYPASPRCYTWPANAATQALVGAAASQVFPAGTSSTSFALTQGSTALTASTAYEWGYKCSVVGIPNYNAAANYPGGSGIPIVVNGGAWGSTITAPAGTVVGTTDTQTLTNKTLTAPAISSPTFSGTVTLPNGTTATTQTTGDNSTKVATDAFVIANSPGSGACIKVVNGVSYSACYTGATVDVRVNACLSDALSLANGNTTGICSAIGETGAQTVAAQITVGNSTGTFEKLELPCGAVWSGSMTDGTSSVIAQYSGTSVVGTCPSSGPAGKMALTATSSSSLGYIYQTITSSNNPYLYMQGFNITNITGGHVTANNIGFYFNGPQFDGTTIDEVNVYDSLDTYAVKAYNVGAATTWQNSSISAGNHGVGIWLSTDNSGYVQSLNLSRMTIVHPGTGQPAILCTDTRTSSTPKISDLQLDHIYTESGTDGTTAAIQIQGCSNVAVDHYIYKSQASSSTSPLITVTNAYNTFLKVDDVVFRPGSGTFTYPATVLVNSFTSETKLTDANGNYDHYAPPTIPTSLGVLTAASITGPIGTGGTANAGTFNAIVDTAITPSTSPICPNGASGAFTTTGCTGGGGGTTTNALTLNNSGSGAASGSTFNGSAAVTLSYNTLGAAPTASPTFTGTVTVTPPSGDAGMIALAGNTTNQTIPTNQFAIMGFASASATAYGWQPTTSQPTAGQLLQASAPSSGVSTISYVSGWHMVQAPTVLTAQAANISSTALYTPAAAGYFRICMNAELTRAATTSSTFISPNFNYTSGTDSVAKFPTIQGGSNASTSNATYLATGGCQMFYSGASAINYSTSGYASSGATTMQYDLIITLEQEQ